MNDTPVSIPSEVPTDLFEERVDRVIAGYLDAARAGDAPDPEELLARHPDLAEELRCFLSDRDCFVKLAGPPAKLTNGETTRLAEPSPTVTTIDAGRYVGLEPHARGGLGEVFTAQDTELHRVVALKRIQDRCMDDPRSVRRFLVEAEVTAGLEHPGVAPVHSLYRDDRRRPCYTMRFIEGRTLEEVIRAYHAGEPDPVAFRRLLQSFIQVCETIAYAHSRGVIHRDLKPRNVMLGKFGETIVVDWGLAKVVGRAEAEGRTDAEATLRPIGDSSGEQTAMGSAVGTPQYMSPEQAAGRWDVIDAASDVYNLGAVLYVMLTGRPPLEGGNWPELQQKIQRGEFPPPRAVRPSVPRALEAVCLKAMSLKPGDRYRSARELAAEVELWLAEEPVQAYREPFGERAWRWARRRRRSLIASGVSGFIALLILGMATWKISIEQAKTKSERNMRKNFDRENGKNILELEGYRVRYRQLERDARETAERTMQIGQNSMLNTPEDQLHEQLLIALVFWDRSIERDDRENTDYYRSQRILCLARMGNHEKAFDEATDLGEDNRLTPESMYVLARAYAILSTAVKEEDRELSDQHADRATGFLLKANEEGYFNNPTTAERMLDDPYLNSLENQEDFQRFLRELAIQRDADSG